MPLNISFLSIISFLLILLMLINYVHVGTINVKCNFQTLSKRVVIVLMHNIQSYDKSSFCLFKINEVKDCVLSTYSLF